MELCVLLALPGISPGAETEAPQPLEPTGDVQMEPLDGFGVAVRFRQQPAARGRSVNPTAPGGDVLDASASYEAFDRVPLGNKDPGSRHDKPTDDEVLQRSDLEQLMSAYVAGSERAFDELYRRLTPKVYGYLLRLARKPERAEDLVQVTYSKLHRARASYLEGAPLLPWVLAIARRAFFDESRALRSRREDLTNEGVLPEPSTSTAGETDTGVLERALAEIPEVYREAVVLTKITGLSLAEAAAVVESTPSAVKLRVHRGYKALREAMERLTHDDAAV